MQKKVRIAELDALRGLAVLAVALFHYTFKYNEEYGITDSPFIFAKGHLGVELFFLISGYVIFMTVEKVSTAKQFVILRFTRLYPVYWTAILVTFLTVNFFGLSGREVSFNSFLFNFTMLQDLGGIPSVDGSYWSLLPELMFYLLMFFVLIFKAKKYILIISICWLVIILIHHFFPFHELAEKIINLKYGMLFIAGIHFYRIKSKLPSPIKLIAADCIVILLCLAMCFLTYENLIDPIIISGFFILFFLLMVDGLFFLRFKPLLFLGAISYPFYLLHQNLGYILMNELNVGFWTELLLAFFVSLVLATIVHYLIEKPSMKYLRKILSNLD